MEMRATGVENERQNECSKTKWTNKVRRVDRQTNALPTDQSTVRHTDTSSDMTICIFIHFRLKFGQTLGEIKKKEIEKETLRDTVNQEKKHREEDGNKEK